MKTIFLHSFVFFIAIPLYLILGIIALILTDSILEWYEYLILGIGVAIIFFACLSLLVQRIVINPKQKLIKFYLGFGSKNIKQRSLELIDNIKVYVLGSNLCFDIDYGKYQETIKMFISARMVNSMKRQSKRIQKRINEYIN